LSALKSRFSVHGIAFSWLIIIIIIDYYYYYCYYYGLIITVDERLDAIYDDWQLKAIS